MRHKRYTSEELADMPLKEAYLYNGCLPDKYKREQGRLINEEYDYCCWKHYELIQGSGITLQLKDDEYLDLDPDDCGKDYSDLKISYLKLNGHKLRMKLNVKKRYNEST